MNNSAISEAALRFKPRLLIAPLALIVASCFVGSPVFSLPTGHFNVTGNVSFKTSKDGSTLTVTNSPNAIINWHSFSIFNGELVKFAQQSASSNVLNRVAAGGLASTIYGTLQSNGNVWLINPNGVLIGNTGKVNVHGFVASSLNITDTNFKNGIYNFGGSPQPVGAVFNTGTITTPEGGKVYLIAPQVTNNGIITSEEGKVMLAAGHQVTLVDSKNPDVAVVVSAAGENAINLGQIIAKTGKVGIFGALISQQGVINADRAEEDEHGLILLKSSVGATQLAGNSTTTAKGGNVTVVGPQVSLTDSAAVEAKTVSLKSTAGNVTQTGGSIKAKNLAASATGGAVALNSPNNAVGTIAGKSDNGFSFVDSTSFKVGTAGLLTGITASGQSINLTSGGSIGTSHATIKGNSLNIDATSGVGSQATPLSTMVNSLAVTNDSGDVAVNNDSALLTVGGITQNGGGNIFTKNTGSMLVGGTVITNNGNIDLQTGGDLTLDGRVTAQGTGGVVTLVAPSGNISQTAPITAKSLAVSAGGSVALNNAINNVGTVAGTAGNGFSFIDANSFNVGTVGAQNGITSIGQEVDLASNGSITQTASIKAQSLSVSAGGSVQLNNANNSVAKLAGKSGGDFSFNDSTSLTVGAVDLLDGIIATGHAINLTSGGSINTNVSTIKGDSLTLNAVSGVGSQSKLLTTEVNLLKVTNGAGEVAVSNESPLLVIDSITQTTGGNIFAKNTGSMLISGAVKTNNGNIGLFTGNNLALDGPVTAEGIDGIVALQAQGNITQTSPIAARSLSVLSGGAVALTNAGNHVGTLASFSVDDFAFNNSTNINVGTVGPLTGITADGHAIKLDSAGAINTIGSATIKGNSLDIHTNSGVGSQANPLATMVNALAITNESNDVTVNNNSTALSITGVTQNGGGSIFAKNSGSITVDGNVGTNNGNVMLTAGTNLGINAPVMAQDTNGIVTLQALAGDIDQTAPITAKSSSASASGSVGLDNQNNVVDTLAGYAGNNFSFADATSFNVGNVGPLSGINARTIDLTSGGSINTSGATIKGNALYIDAASGVGSQANPLSTSLTTLVVTNGSGDVAVNNDSGLLNVNGIKQKSGGNISSQNTGSMIVGGAVTTNDGNIGLSTGGKLALNGPVTAQGTNGIVTLQAVGNVFQTSPITAKSLAVSAGGLVGLSNASNQVGTIAGKSGDDFSFKDATSFNVGTVGSLSGITAIGHAISLMSGGSINTDGATIIGDSLDIHTGSGVGSLVNPLSTSVNSLGVINGSGVVNLSNDSASLGITGITQLSGGNIFAKNTGSLALDGAVGTNDTVTLQSLTGDITQTSPIDAKSLLAIAAGKVNLGNGGNNVGTIAGSSGNGFIFTDAPNFNVGTVGGVSGITAVGQPVNLTSGGSIGSSGGIITADKLIIDAVSGVGSQANPLPTAVNSLGITNGSGDIAVTNDSNLLHILGIIQTTGGNIFTKNTGSMTVDGTVSTGNGDVGLLAGVNLALNAPVIAHGTHGIVALQTINGNITQTAPITAQSLSASAGGSGNVDLTNPGNTVVTFAGAAGGGGVDFAFANHDAQNSSVPLVGPNFTPGFFIPGVDASDFNLNDFPDVLKASGNFLVELDSTGKGVKNGKKKKQAVLCTP